NWSPAGVPAAPGDVGVITTGTLAINGLNLTGVATQMSSANAADPVTLDVRNSTLGIVLPTEFGLSFTPLADINTTGNVTLANSMILGGGLEGLTFGSTVNLDIGGGRLPNPRPTFCPPFS